MIFETHSTSEDNERGIATGWLPGRLSAEGRRQAAELGRRRAGRGYDAVFTSDLTRALETAEIAFGESGLAIIQEPRLRECNYGLLNGAPVSTIETVRRHHIDEPFPNGESYRQVVDRVSEFLGELSGRQRFHDVVLIGHSATRWALDHLLNGVPLEDLVDAPFGWQEGWVYTLSRRRA